MLVSDSTPIKPSSFRRPHEKDIQHIAKGVSFKSDGSKERGIPRG